MPRKARLDACCTVHHVMARGIERSAIFRNDKDRGHNRTRQITRVRSYIAHSLSQEGISRAEIARQLGVSHVAALKMVKKESGQ